MSRVAQGGALVVALVAFIGGVEGLRTHGYLDSVGVPTVCYGHTQGVKLSDHYTPAQCKEMLRKDLEIYAKGIEACVHVPLPDRRYVALVSFAFNVGVEGACGSKAIRLINAGRTREGCDALLNWLKPRVISGRRYKERELCLADLPL